MLHPVLYIPNTHSDAHAVSVGAYLSFARYGCGVASLLGALINMRSGSVCLVSTLIFFCPSPPSDRLCLLLVAHFIFGVISFHCLPLCDSSRVSFLSILFDSISALFLSSLHVVSSNVSFTVLLVYVLSLRSSSPSPGSPPSSSPLLSSSIAFANLISQTLS